MNAFILFEKSNVHATIIAISCKVHFRSHDCCMACKNKPFPFHMYAEELGLLKSG